MNTVPQEHPSGCAVSCVAALSGISYPTALKLFRNVRYARFRGFYCKEVVAALKKTGKKYGFAHYGKSNKKWLTKPNVIVFIQKSRDHEMGHYLVRSPNGKWMDPWINYPMMNPVRAGFRRKIPGKPQWIIFPKEKE